MENDAVSLAALFLLEEELNTRVVCDSQTFAMAIGLLRSDLFVQLITMHARARRMHLTLEHYTSDADRDVYDIYDGASLGSIGYLYADGVVWLFRDVHGNILSDRHWR